jgi:8-oxo-dGTP pyrophosphatase MutT (NUDIX family)
MFLYLLILFFNFFPLQAGSDNSSNQFTGDMKTIFNLTANSKSNTRDAQAVAELILGSKGFRQTPATPEEEAAIRAAITRCVSILGHTPFNGLVSKAKAETRNKPYAAHYIVVSAYAVGVIYQSDIRFTSQVTAVLPNLTFTKHLGGGSGGVHVFKSPTGQEYTLKASKNNTPHMQEEIVADALYTALGVPVPQFIVLNTLPNSPAFADIKRKFPSGPYRIAEFINGSHHITAAIKEFFLVDALLANRDIKGSNVIVRSDGTTFRIDTGGSVRFRAQGAWKGGKGDKKPWSPVLIPEVITFFTDKDDKVYGDKISDAEIKEQAQQILRKAKDVLDQLKRITLALNLPLVDQQELQHMLQERLQLVNMFVNKNQTFAAPQHVPVTPMMAAGAFITTKIEETACVLLGQRKSSRRHVNGTWCTPGGAADVGKDGNIALGAAREIREESNGLINITGTDLSSSPSHDLVRWNERFRQYFVNRSFANEGELRQQEAALNAKLRTATTPTGKEYHQFKWVPLNTLIAGIPSGDIEGVGRIYAPFWDLLKTTQTQINLLKIVRGESLLSNQHTQSWTLAP